MRRTTVILARRIVWLLLVSLIMLMNGCGLFKKKPAPPPKPAPTENPAITSGKLRVQKIDDKLQLAQGIWAQGYLGDYVLENDRIRAIISAPGHTISDIKGGGHIIDLCLREYPHDYIRGLCARIGSERVPQYTYNRIQIKTTGYAENGAAIMASGKTDPGQPALAIRTQYLLKPDEPIIEITTTLTNLTTGTLKDVELGDIADWGACISFVGNHGIINRWESKHLKDVGWFSGYIDNFSAGFTQKKEPIEGKFQENKAFVSYKKATIEPGRSVSYTRFLIVSDKSLSPISDFAFAIREPKYGFISGTVIQLDTKEHIPDVDVRIVISRRGDKTVPARPFARTFSDANGNFQLTVPEGSYFIGAKAFARRSAKNRLSFFVPDGDSYVTQLQVSRTSKLKFTCKAADTGEMLPCKLTFLNIPRTRPLNRGPGDALYARDVYYSATGDETIDVPIGRYKVIFSRGIEYDSYEEEILIAFTKENVINAKLHHILDVKGYISADIGVRTNKSYDCYVSPEDRIVTAAAEGVEYLVSGDCNKATDLSAAVKKLGLEHFVKTGIGKKIEFMGEKNLGHFLVWPLKGANVQAAADNSELDAETPRKLFKVLRSKYPGALIQVNRAIFPVEGYFKSFGYDHKEKPVIKDKKFSYDFDLLEVWEGKRLGAAHDTVQLLYDTWLGGYNKIMPIGDTFSHATWGEEVGYPRVYVASSTDDAAKISEEEIVESIKKGNLLITNGPIIKFTVNGQPPGSFITDTDGTVDCHLEVMAAPWVPTSYIDVNMDGIFSRRILQPISKGVVRFPRESSSPGTENFKMKIKKDTFINAVVVGSKRNTLSPIVSALPYEGEGGVMALAITAPVIIDYDGNGKYDPPPPDEVGM